LGASRWPAIYWSGRSVVRVRFKGAAFRWPLFYDILKVGVVAALITVQTNLTNRDRNRSGRSLRPGRDRRFRHRITLE